MLMTVQLGKLSTIKSNLKAMKKLLYLSLLLFFYACPLSDTDKCDDPVPEFRLDDDFRSYFDFKPGTYWIYEDSLTGTEDSVYISGYRSKFFEDRVGRDDNGCGIVRKKEEIFINVANQDSTEEFVGRVTNVSSNGDILQNYASNSFFALYRYPSFVNVGNTSPQVIFYADTINLNAYLFKKLLLTMTITEENGFPKDTFNTLWAKNIGIIRRETQNGKILRIKRYSINQ